ncbi:MAG: hypothetical protein QXR97_00155 [Thermoproteota archaeon]
MPEKNYWDKGQIILVMCMTLVIVIISVATIIYLTSTHHLFFNYNPSREIILSIDADFERALTRILANATMQYNKTRTVDSDVDEMEEARLLANKTFSYWFLATQAAYSGKGVNIEADWIDDVIQREKDMPIRIGWISKQGHPGQINPIPVQHYPTRSLESKLVKLFWYRPSSISAIGSRIKIDSVINGIVGWESTHIVLLNLTITSIWSDERNELVYYNVVVLRENEEPVNDLKEESFELYWFDPTTPPGVFWWRRAKGDEITATYNGGGNYTLTLKPRFANDQSDKKKFFWNWGADNNYVPGYYRFVIVRVKDNRDIIVEAYSYSGIEYVIQEKAVEPHYPNNPAKTKETYVFELLPNGTMYWFEDKLICSSKVCPIPFPPVKQLRVNVTVNYDEDISNSRKLRFIEAPYQVEIWDNRYLWPSSTNFLGWRKRFMNGSKLVFEVTYPPGCARQAVRVFWEDDCDAKIPEYRIEMKVIDGVGRIDTGSKTSAKNSYIIWVLVDKLRAQNIFEHLDWSISFRDRANVSHVEYILPAYDSYLSDHYYIPIKFPEDMWNIVPEPKEDPENPNVRISRAPVRIVLFRRSDRVVYTSPHPQQGKEVLPKELYYEDIIYIPYNVSYFLYRINASWLRDVKIEYSYLVFAGIVGGFPDNDDIPLTLRWFKWGSLLKPDGTVINGTFNNEIRPNVGYYMPHRGHVLGQKYGDGSYSYWIALYNESWGAGLFVSQQFLDMLDLYGKTYKKRDRETDQLFVWTRDLGASRFMEYDAITLERYGDFQQSVEIKRDKTPKIELKFAGFMLRGGVADENTKYDNDNDWNDGGRTYARPFTVLYDSAGSAGISDIQREGRSAFAYDDFSENPFSNGKLITSNPNYWTYDQNNGLISGIAPDGSFTTAHFSQSIKPGTRTVNILAKERHITSASGQYSGLMLSEGVSSQSRFYTLSFFRTTRGTNNNFRRLGILRYSPPNSWNLISQTPNSVSLNLGDNVWFIFYGSRTLQGTGWGSMALTVYDSQGNPINGASLSCTDTSIPSLSSVGLCIRDENSDSNGNTIRADFDFFIACSDADPRIVTVKNVCSGYRVIIRDRYGNVVAQATATSDTVTLNVIKNPVIRNGCIEILNNQGNLLFSKTFENDFILGGDVYRCILSEAPLNPVKECNMYYRMFTCRSQDMPEIIDIGAAY